MDIHCVYRPNIKSRACPILSVLVFERVGCSSPLLSSAPSRSSRLIAVQSSFPTIHCLILNQTLLPMLSFPCVYGIRSSPVYPEPRRVLSPLGVAHCPSASSKLPSPCRAEIPTLLGPKVPALSGSLPTIALNPLAATLTDLPASVANKRLTVRLSPLDATLAKNTGLVGPPFQPENRRTFASSYTLLSGGAPCWKSPKVPC